MDRWASVSSREWPAAGWYRHIVRKRHDTSACGVTALPYTIWRGNSKKPKCPLCLDRAADPDFPY